MSKATLTWEKDNEMGHQFRVVRESQDTLTGEPMNKDFLLVCENMKDGTATMISLSADDRQRIMDVLGAEDFEFECCDD
jgi:hypothetical protein